MTNASDSNSFVRRTRKHPVSREQMYRAPGVSARRARRKLAATHLSTVRLRRTVAPDVSRKLANELTARTADEELGWDRHLNRHVVRDSKQDRVRKAQLEVEPLLAGPEGGVPAWRHGSVLDGRSEADANQLDGQPEALGHAGDGIGEQLTRRAPHLPLGLDRLIIDRNFEHTLAVGRRRAGMKKPDVGLDVDALNTERALNRKLLTGEVGDKLARRRVGDGCAADVRAKRWR